jgi:hypothetical protein
MVIFILMEYHVPTNLSTLLLIKRTNTHQYVKSLVVLVVRHAHGRAWPSFVVLVIRPTHGLAIINAP